ncbi:GDSL family lipase [Heliobacterium undosum]|uniref:GDSL family lipase n=1 Tax=Heliomicrobium undosum TaxID=121734 RepID=A0A845L5Q5_9FIRM|nr:GDSL-type esterase/lipase family protein [Heliomicrobium undosum]MZP30000.1 GDSL family lipase [Heliomicrobium undosum]
MKGKQTNDVIFLFLLICIFGILGQGWWLGNGFLEKNMNTDTSRFEKTNADKAPFVIVAMGDSLTKGTGDSSGKGYVGYLVDRIQESANRRVALSNIAVNGEKSGQLLGKLKHPSVRKQVEAADVIVMTIGANDLLTGETIKNINFAQLQKNKAEYVRNLRAILSHIRSQNTKANIFYLGLYNPFSNVENAALTSSVIQNWNATSARVCAGFPKTAFVPTFDLFSAMVKNYLSNDMFHPNARGYRLMAERLAQYIL